MTFKILKNRLLKGIVTARIDLKPEVPTATVTEEGKKLLETIRERFGRSLRIREVDTGSCGACESEIIACSNPLYDIQRFGIDFVASPRHADALLVTGPVSKNMERALKDTYEAMADPKFVIALGDCALHGGCFGDSYYTCGGVSRVIPVALHIPGCPPAPSLIIEALLKLLNARYWDSFAPLWTSEPVTPSTSSRDK